MVKIIIMDDNRSLGAYLKKMLASEAHAVTLVHNEGDALASLRIGRANLIMINQSCGHNGGWRIYNKLKQSNSAMPLMVYHLDDYRPVAAGWIVKAVDEVIACQKKIQREAVRLDRSVRARGVA